MLIVNPFIGMTGGAYFDGTAYVKRGGIFTGAANGKKGIFSGWIKRDANTAAMLSSGNSGAAIFTVLNYGSGQFEFAGLGGTTGATVFDIITSGTYSSGAWHHLLASWDLGNNLKNMYVDDVSDLSVSIFTNEALLYTSAAIDWHVGALSDSQTKLTGSLAEIYFNTSEYLDFSDVSNRRKFISAAGKPVPLGTNGALPTGNAPIVYQSIGGGKVNDFALNLGTGGNFSIVNSLAGSPTNPSD